MRVRYFETPEALHAWLEANHDRADELWVGFHKKASGRGGITYFEALDAALCFGWIDGVRRSVDAARYTNRFSPRQPKSHWSAVNLKRYAALRARGAVRPAGEAAFARRATKAAPYSYENRPQRLPAALEKTFVADAKAWAFFQAQPPGYRRSAIWWVVSAVREATQARRLATLMRESRQGRRLAPLAGVKAARAS
jgi:uncharacterized protein YdeI (YjbR/CyaY-like superfamily)